MSTKNWWGLDLLQLRDELKSKGLDINGSKPVLVRRLEMYEDSYKKRLEALKAKSKPVAQESSPVKSGTSPSTKPSESKPEQSTAKQEPTAKPGPTPPKPANTNGKSEDMSNNKPSSQQSTNNSQGKPAAVEVEKPKDWWSMSMQELKNECSNRGLSFMGNKYTLVNRLKTFEDYQTEKGKKGGAPAATTTAASRPGTGSATIQSTKPSTTGTISKPVTTSVAASKSLTNVAVTKPTSSITTAADTKPTSSITTAAVTKTTTAISSVVTKPVTKPPTSAPAIVTPQKAAAIPPNPNVAKYEKMTFAQLKIECVNKKLDITGSKPDLINRLVKFHETATTPPASSSKVPTTPQQTQSTPTQSKINIQRPSPKPASSAFGSSPNISSVSKSPASGDRQSKPLITSPISITRVTGIASKPGSNSWTPAAQKYTNAAQAQASPPPVKKVITYVKSVQTLPLPPPPVVKKPVMFAKIIQTVTQPKRHTGIQTINFAEETEKIMPVKSYFKDEQVEIAKKFSAKLPQWDGGDNQMPDLTIEYEPAKKADTRSKTIVAYPMSFKDLQDPKFTAVRQTAKDINVNFEDRKTLNKSMKGSIVLKFFTCKAAEFAVTLLKSWRRDLKVERLHDKLDLDDALKRVGSKVNKLEPLVNRLVFLNKLPMKLKEGDLAEKFSDAVSITIARDALNVSKGYGFVEYNSRNDAQTAANRTKNLYMEGGRIDVKLYPKVPSDLTEDKSKLAMPDHERIRLAEQHHKATLDFNKTKSGPYNRDRSEEQKLLKEMSVLEEKLAVDAAIRKKLNYSSLPEPAAFMSAELRRAWQTGNFSSFKVDLGKVHKSWEEPKFKDAPPAKQGRFDGPPAPKQGRFDDEAKRSFDDATKKASSLAATLSQLKSMPGLDDDRKRKEASPQQQQQGSWNQRNRQQPPPQQQPPQNVQSSWNRQGDQQSGWGSNQQQTNTWGKQQTQLPHGREGGSDRNMPPKSFGNQQGSSSNIPSLFDSTVPPPGMGARKDSKTDLPSFGRSDSGADFRKGGPGSWNSGMGGPPPFGSKGGRGDRDMGMMGLPSSVGGKKPQDSDLGFPSSFGGKKAQEPDMGLPTSFGGRRGPSMDMGLPTSFGGKKGLDSDMGLPTSFGGKKAQDSGLPTSFGRKNQDSDSGFPTAFGKGNQDSIGFGKGNRSDSSFPTAFGSGGGNDPEGDLSGFGAGKSSVGKAMLEGSRGGGMGRGGFNRGGSGRGFPQQQDRFREQDSPIGGGFKDQQMSRGRGGGFPDEDSNFGRQRPSFPDESMPGQPLSQGGFPNRRPMQPPQQQQQPKSLLDSNFGGPMASKNSRLSQDSYNKFYEGEDMQQDEHGLPTSFAGRDQGGGKSMDRFDKGNKWDDDQGEFTDDRSIGSNRSRQSMGRGFGQKPPGMGIGNQGRFDDSNTDEQDMGYGKPPMGRGRGRGGMMGQSGMGRFGNPLQQRQQPMDDAMDLDEEEMDSQQGSFNRGRLSQIGGADESFYGDTDQGTGQFRRTPGATKDNYGQDGNFGDTPKNQFGQARQRGFGGRPGGQGMDDQAGIENYDDYSRMDDQGMNKPEMRGQGWGNQGIRGQGMGNQGMQGMGNQGGQGMGNQGMQGQGMGNQGMQGQGMGNQRMRGNQGMENDRFDNQGMRQGAKPGNQGMQGPGMGRPGMMGSGMDNRPGAAAYGHPQQEQKQREESPSKTSAGGMGYGQQQMPPKDSMVGGSAKPAGQMQQPQSGMPKPPLQQPQQPAADQSAYGYGAQQPQQPDAYGQYDQAAYESYYGNQNQQYDYSQYDYSQIDYSRYGQYDYTTGQWSHPYGDYNPQEAGTAGKKPPQPPYSTATGQAPQPPPPQLPPPSSNYPGAAGGAGDASTMAEGDEDTVNVELVKKLSGAVTTLRQQMGYVADQQPSQTPGASSNSPAFVSNMAYSQQSTQPGLYSGLRQSGYLNT